MPHHICSTCGESWDDAFEACPQDGTALVAMSPPRTRTYGEPAHAESADEAWFTSPMELALLRSSDGCRRETKGARGDHALIDLSGLCFPAAVDRNARTRRDPPCALMLSQKDHAPAERTTTSVFVGRKLRSAAAYSETGVFGRPLVSSR
jgi:hypothetical protein